ITLQRKKKRNQHVSVPSRGWHERARPGRETCLATERELPHPARLDVQHPQLMRAGTRRREHQMPTVRRVGWIFVAAFARELLDAAIAEADCLDLEYPTDPRSKRD